MSGFCTRNTELKSKKKSFSGYEFLFKTIEEQKEVLLMFLLKFFKVYGTENRMREVYIERVTGV